MVATEEQRNGRVKKQFDICIMNPPYQGNMHASFLDAAIRMSDRVVSIQPINWLLVDEDEEGSAILSQTKKAVQPFRKHVELINGNGLFNASFFMPCTILYLDKTVSDKSLDVTDVEGKKWKYEDIFDFNKFGNIPNYYSIVTKTGRFAEKGNCWDNWVQSRKKGKGKFFVNLARVRGHVVKSGKGMIDADFYTLVTRDLEPSSTREKFYHFGFRTKAEAENFILFLRQKVTRFCFAINKHGSSIRRKQLQTIPWLDFSKKWTDSKLRTHFGITSSEWKFIDSVIADY